jgi:uridine kinase
MKIKVIGITGGSGAGKSTLCNALKNKYPDRIELLQLDDYLKPREEKPKVGDLVNSDHPDSLYFDKFILDLEKLLKGESVTLYTRNEFLNPDFFKNKEKTLITLSPKPIILVEGFLLLHNESVRRLLDTSIFLNAEHDIRWARRPIRGNSNKEYEENVIIPMHNQYIEPTKKYADHVIDISNLTKEEVFKKAEEIIFPQ